MANFVLAAIGIFLIAVVAASVLTFFLGRWFFGAVLAGLCLVAVALIFLLDREAEMQAYAYLGLLVGALPPAGMGAALGGWAGLWLRAEYKNHL